MVVGGGLVVIGVPSDYLFSTQLQLWLFCCWAVTILLHTIFCHTLITKCYIITYNVCNILNKHKPIPKLIFDAVKKFSLMILLSENLILLIKGTELSYDSKCLLANIGQNESKFPVEIRIS